MKKWVAMTLALACLAGCAPLGPVSDTPADDGYVLWFATAAGREESYEETPFAVAAESRTWEGEPGVEELLTALLDGPQSGMLVSPFPAGLEVLDIRTNTQSETVQVDLSEPYGSLSGFDLTVADYCITKTLCQIPWVRNVRILVEGANISYRDRRTLQESDLLLSGITEEPDTFLAVLYFPSRDGLGLAVEYRQVPRSGDSGVEVIMTELLRGPSGSDAGGTLPDGTRVLGLSVSGGICQVDLSAEFVNNAPSDEGKASVVLYSLVNSLCTLGGISQVRLLVDGSALQSYHGVATGTPISANFDLVG